MVSRPPGQAWHKNVLPDACCRSTPDPGSQMCRAASICARGSTMKFPKSESCACWFQVLACTKAKASDQFNAGKTSFSSTLSAILMDARGQYCGPTGPCGTCHLAGRRLHCYVAWPASIFSCDLRRTVPPQSVPVLVTIDLDPFLCKTCDD